jgi:hypothetical protein
MLSQIVNALAPWLCSGLMLGIPVWLAWWLSDGFKGWRRMPPSRIEYRNVVNPKSGRTIIAPVSEQTGLPVAWPD